jgi:hypothetical protein
MRAAKVIGLGIFFSFVGFVMLLVFSIMRGPVSFGTGAATGLSAVVGGIIGALFNPISLLVIAAVNGGPLQTIAASLAVRATN